MSRSTASLISRSCVPPKVKQSVCGYGRADKEQVQRMVKTILAPRRAADARTTPPTRSRSRSATRSRRRSCEMVGVVISRLRGTDGRAARLPGS